MGLETSEVVYVAKHTSTYLGIFSVHQGFQFVF